MLEILILTALVMLLPLTGLEPLWIVVILLAWQLLCVPGVILMFRVAPPFVPTPKRLVDEMMQRAKIKKGETVYDLGCGDGRILRAAAKQGAKAVGYEFSIPTFLLAKLRCFRNKNIDVRYGDIWKQNYRDADVLFCYLLPEAMQQLHRDIWPTLKPGARVVSHAFRMKAMSPEQESKQVILYRKEKRRKSEK